MYIIQEEENETENTSLDDESSASDESSSDESSSDGRNGGKQDRTLFPYQSSSTTEKKPIGRWLSLKLGCKRPTCLASS